MKPRRRPNSSVTDGSEAPEDLVLKPKKKLNARQLLKIEKKASKKERRARIAPLIGLENTTDLNLSENELPYFPCACDQMGNSLMEETSLMSCRFKSLTSLNLTRNRLTGIDGAFFTHTSALTSLDLRYIVKQIDTQHILMFILLFALVLISFRVFRVFFAEVPPVSRR